MLPWCYHANCLPSNEESYRDIRKRVDFSDPQGGKGACDRKAASVKAHIRRYINEGHDVVSAEDLRLAILSNSGLRGVRVCLLDMSDVKTSKPMTVERVSLMNNFEYTVVQ